jgi:hypothetical protein
MGWRHFMKAAFMGEVTPRSVFDRPGREFCAPVDRWLQTAMWKERIEEYLSWQSVKDRGLFSPDYVRGLLRRFYAGARTLKTECDSKGQQLGPTIWSLAALEAWYREFIDRSQSPM